MGHDGLGSLVRSRCATKYGKVFARAKWMQNEL